MALLATVEMTHFFGAMGTDVVIVGPGDVLADREDRDIAERLTDAYAAKHELHLGYEVTALAADDGKACHCRVGN